MDLVDFRHEVLAVPAIIRGDLRPGSRPARRAGTVLQVDPVVDGHIAASSDLSPEREGILRRNGPGRGRGAAWSANDGAFDDGSASGAAPEHPPGTSATIYATAGMPDRNRSPT